MAADSDDEVSNDETENEDDQIVEYTCRKCVGITISKDKMEEHREMHRKQKKKVKPGPKSRKRTRNSSPVPSEATLFSVVKQPAAKPKPPSDKKKDRAERMERSKKDYNKKKKKPRDPTNGG